jgi:AcrR family transcriptional regulator
VTKVASKKQERIARRQVDKFAERRARLAASALQTLSELGYARTSLRDIAQNSEFSHGVLHYYFSDKVDLIIQSVKQYKAECVKRTLLPDHDARRRNHHRAQTRPRRVPGTD